MLNTAKEPHVLILDGMLIKRTRLKDPKRDDV